MIDSVNAESECASEVSENRASISREQSTVSSFNSEDVVLIDFDHIAESNTNRQLHALEGEYGKAKVQAMTERIRHINPEIMLTSHDGFLEPENLDILIPENAIVLDATDSVQTKIALAVWASKNERALVMCGAAGGKSDPTSVRCDDLSRTEQDALLAKVRQGLRQDHGFSRNLKRKITDMH
jgi:tRNA A37 threonylcarbamoyladenosine dehydratase